MGRMTLNANVVSASITLAQPWIFTVEALSRKKPLHQECSTKCREFFVPNLHRLLSPFPSNLRWTHLGLKLVSIGLNRTQSDSIGLNSHSIGDEVESNHSHL